MEAQVPQRGTYSGAAKAMRIGEPKGGCFHSSPSPLCVFSPCPFRPAKVVFTPQTVSGGRVVLCCNVIKHTRSIDPIEFIHVALITTCLYCSRRLFQVSLAKTQKLVPLDGGINGGRAPRYVTQSAPIEHYIMMQWESLCAA